MRKTIQIVLFFFVSIVFGAAAVAAEWSVVSSSGEVWIGSPGAQPVSLGVGATLPDGGTVATGKDGRVLLVRGAETIVIGPNALIEVPQESADGQFTTILQRAGVVEFNVEKRNVEHFAVETPFLAAVVKGTHFAVGAFDAAGVVKVARGRVEVFDLASGQFADVLAGQEAIVRLNQDLLLSGKGKLSDIEQGTPREPVVDGVAPGLLQAAVSGGGLKLGLGSGLAVGVGDGLALGLGLGGGNGLALGQGGGDAGGLGLGLDK